MCWWGGEYQAVLRLSLIYIGKFQQHNESSANKMLPIFPKEECRRLDDSYTKSQVNAASKLYCCPSFLFPTMVVLMYWLVTAKRLLIWNVCDCTLLYLTAVNAHCFSRALWIRNENYVKNYDVKYITIQWVKLSCICLDSHLTWLPDIIGMSSVSLIFHKGAQRNAPSRITSILQLLFIKTELCIYIY